MAPNVHLMARPFLRLAAATAALLAASACGSGAPDTEVLGARVAATDDSTPAEAPTTTTTAAEPAPTTTTSTTAPAPEPTPVPEPTTTTTTVAPAPAGAAALRLSLALEATEVPAGSDVRGVLTAENPTDQDVDLTHPSLCETEQGLYQGGQAVTEAMVCASALKPDHIGPHETRTWSIRIVTEGVAPGTYEARAGINLRREPDAYAPGVPVTLLP
ncbi:MAG: hypothetical protein HYU28_03145 [Actinobacteria bacterium]|nr:hypothetical protein [Actinomycetota bacterium]